MKYKLCYDPTKWTGYSSRAGRVVSYNDVYDWIGSVVLEFEYRGNKEVYENHYTNIPLFLTELDNFLRRTTESKISRWYLGFAPFAYGKRAEGALLISSRSGKNFCAHVYDETSITKLKVLEDRVKSDLYKIAKIAEQLPFDGACSDS